MPEFTPWSVDTIQARIWRSFYRQNLFLWAVFNLVTVKSIMRTHKDIVVKEGTLGTGHLKTIITQLYLIR